MSPYGFEIVYTQAAVFCHADHLQATCTQLSVGVLTKHVVNVTIGQLLFVYDFRWVQFFPSLKLRKGSVD